MNEIEFWSNVDMLSPMGCWLWTGPLSSSGYGRFGKQYAHRISLSLKVGYGLRESECALHSCDVPACVSWKHLRVGSKRDNSQDMKIRGRGGAKKQTHCNKGHEFTPENVYVRPDGDRACRECKRQNQRARRKNADH